MLLHLLVVGFGNSRDTGPDGLGRRLCGERSGGYNRSIGEEIEKCGRHYMCSFYTARSAGIDIRKEGGARRGA